MNDFLPVPKAVQEAKESQKGLHWILEILVFVLVFFISTFAEGIVLVPIQLITMFTNKEYLAAIVSRDMSRAMQLGMELSTTDNMMIATLFSTIMMILVVILFCKLIQKRKASSIGFVKKGAGIEYIKGIVAGFVLFSVAVLICVITGSLEFNGVSDTFALSAFLLFTIGYMFQGMAEEVLCRGYFMVSVGRRYPMLAAVILNSVAFAALHLGNPGVSVLAIVNLTLFGIFASVCFIKTENIWLVGAIHSVWNLVQGNVYGIKVSGMESSCTILSSTMTEGKELINGGAFGLEGGIAVTITLVVATALLCLYKKKEAE
ncbi:MAG: CPBP family intramembrane metalloprotease [Lachnospiraceae bacterium]|nr:CPBP family intramembrane metalloprotease [Lachnospiraceae bacterium]